MRVEVQRERLKNFDPSLHCILYEYVCVFVRACVSRNLRQE